MARPVKCLECGKEFYKDKEECVKVKNRYCHAECYKTLTHRNEERAKLIDFINNLYYPTEVNWKLVGAQIKRYKDEGMTYTGMRLTLEYFFSIRKNDLSKSRGVGIIPYVYDQARNYYMKLEKDKMRKAEIESTQTEPKQTTNIITITTKENKKKLLSFDY